MSAIRQLAERYWSGELTTGDRHPFAITGEIEELGGGIAFFHWFANLIVVKTSEGLVLIDTGGYFNQAETLAKLRSYDPGRISTVIYTHGHVDHVGGMPAIVAEAQHNHLARPKVVGHRAVAARFDRYRRTIGYNSVINTRQFSARSNWPAEYVYPDTYFEAKFTALAGGERFECCHGRGETDDHCWVYIPSRRVLCSGDFFIWAVPNAGNPQKVQRYAREWAQALRAMAKIGAEVLAPGHGVPIYGARNVRQALGDTADYLQSLHDQTLELMNAGATLDEVIHAVKPPPALGGKPYLQPVYDEPEFIVRNIWRLDGGWYDGVPSHLKPAPEAEQAREVAALAGGAERLTARALELLEAGELPMACQLADWAVAAAPADKAAHAARAKIYAARAAASSSTMSFGIFNSTARAAALEAGLEPPPSNRRF